MQYILSQFEYDELIKQKQRHNKVYLDELQKICTMACDCCPVQNRCPYESKDWSK